MSPLRRGVCTSCHQDREIRGRGWCGACWYRWDKAGRPDSGPPPAPPRHLRGAPGWAALAARTAGRIEDIRELDAQGLCAKQIARRLNLSTRTVQRMRTRARQIDAQVDRVMALLYPEEEAAA